MSNLTLQSRISRSKELVSSEMDGEVVMMSVSTGTYYGLNEVGTHIWTLIEAPMTIDEICKELRGEFNVDAATCEQEVLNFVTQMAGEQLINISE